MAADRDGKHGAAREAFERGALRGRDPESSEGAREARGGAAVTSLRSSWLGRPCGRCGHTFRRGDGVVVSPEREVIHAWDGALSCPGEVRGAGRVKERGGEQARGDERAAFYAGVARAYPPPAELPIVRLAPDHPLVAPSAPVFRRAACALCGHSLRPFDEVVICPCSPDAPLCSGAVHRDPLRTLYCWDEWQKSHLGRFCPVTSRRLP